MPSPIATGLMGRCPRCAKGRLFAGFLTLVSRCDACGLDYAFADSADAPAVFATFIVGFVVVGGALWLEFAHEPPLWVHAVVWVPLAVALSLAVLRPLKGLMIALQYAHKAGEGRP